MKRREILKIMAPALLVGACKENEKFTLPTIVTGKVTYEDGSPVEGAELKFSGSRKYNVLKILPVFEITVYTNASGTFNVSHIVPKECNIVRVRIVEGSIDEPTPAYGHDIYFSIDKAFYQSEDTYVIPYGDYGKTTTIDYELRKR